MLTKRPMPQGTHTIRRNSNHNSRICIVNSNNIGFLP